ncbi:MAG TPA: 2Fe-2S iron-sulfur cluster-binding protein [Burkholderiales bacterium]|nr:2Fe-2S iron-sulfur cluster-binding protein [Burkholderiales bacterium]
MKKTISLTVNGTPVAADVEPRLQLADFLREHLMLTGTHLGCEHGVCGACTIEMNGAPARSCIAYAVACEGAQVRTIEGFGEDTLMAELREAFSAEHALQCGYCTPGMLVTARDIVLRLPDADEARIRKELSGNLCRCTGYVGIVRAIQRVLKQRGGVATSSPLTPTLSPVPGARGSVVKPALAPQNGPGEALLKPALAPRGGERVGVRGNQAASAQKPQTTLHQSFTVAHPRTKVWEFFGRLDEVTSCLPGASVIGTPSDESLDVRLRVKVGPIVSEFEGAAHLERDPVTYTGTIHGSARDTRSSSATRGEIRYALHEAQDGAATRVEVDVGFTLTGTLAQFGRSSIVQDIAKRMTAAFAQNLEARLAQPGAASAAAPARELDAGALFFSALWARIKGFFRR